MFKLLCPKCEVLMDYDKEKHFFACACCKGEFWPSEERDFRDAEELWRSEQSYKKGMAKPGGGSRSGKKREEKRKIKPVYAIYE